MDSYNKNVPCRNTSVSSDNRIPSQCCALTRLMSKIMLHGQTYSSWQSTEADLSQVWDLFMALYCAGRQPLGWNSASSTRVMCVYAVCREGEKRYCTGTL